MFRILDNPRNDFISIPHSMWWAVVTMCTVGKYFAHCKYCGHKDRDILFGFNIFILNWGRNDYSVWKIDLPNLHFNISCVSKISLVCMIYWISHNFYDFPNVEQNISDRLLLQFHLMQFLIHKNFSTFPNILKKSK